MSTSVNAQIARILEQRRPLTERIKNTQARLLALSGVLDDLEKNRVELVSNDSASRYNGLQEIDFSMLQPEISKFGKELDKLYARFSRETLNIGVVGRARQGKSRLLQSLTGLSAAEIPDGSRQHCTGVRSTIYHRPGTETWGEVFFYTENAFLKEVIAPYYINLGLGKPPVTIEQFVNSSLPSPPDEATQGAQFEHLRKYHERAPFYQKLLQQASPLRIEQSKIPEYVAQHNLQKPEERYDNYMAVREVRIYCPFPNTDAERIALIDMPGLGDTGIGDETRMIQALGEEVDIVLFVRMPKPNGDHWADVDVQLYDTANKALPEIPLSRWSFMVLNQLENGTNTQLCQDLAGSIENQHIYTAQAFIANCADPEKASQQILSPILKYIAQHIAALDKEYIHSHQHHIEDLRVLITETLTKASSVISNTHGRSEELRVFVPLFDSFWKELTFNLEDLLEELEKERKSEDPHFKSALEDSLKRAHEDTGIPSLEDIVRESRSKGAINEAYTRYLRIIRTRLTQHFQALDQGLLLSVQETKNKISDVLKNAGLKTLPIDNDKEFLQELLSLIEKDGGLPTLQEGFSALVEFQLLFRGMVQHRIREKLDILVSDKTDILLPKEPKAEDAMERLETAHGEVLSRIEQPLRDLLWEPSMAKFAVVEDFIDRVLRAESAEREWNFLIDTFKGELWPAEFLWHSLVRKATQEAVQLTMEG
jgi:hypothetical protein